MQEALLTSFKLSSQVTTEMKLKQLT